MRHTLALASVVAVVLIAAATSIAAPAERPSDRTAVVDRLGDDHAVLLVERGDETTDQRVVDPEAIPEAGRSEGARLEVVDDGYRYDSTDPPADERSLSDRFDELADRLRAASGGPTAQPSPLWL